MEEPLSSLLVAVHDRRQLDAALDEAVEQLRARSLANRIGISVTRLTPGHYEVKLNPDIPWGTTIESWGCERPQ